MIGSHNTMSYLPVKQWYFKPLFWTARCQSKDIPEQYYKYKVRLFDIRVKFDKSGDLYFAHGPIMFKGDINKALSTLNTLHEGDTTPLYCRVILEGNKPAKDQVLQEEHFTYFCENIQKLYKNIKFFGGNRKYDWKIVYKFNTEDPVLDDKYSSTTDFFDGKTSSFRAKLDDLWPWLYAKTHNKKNRENHKSGILFLDFVQY